jgi:hypothetical protein
VFFQLCDFITILEFSLNHSILMTDLQHVKESGLKHRLRMLNSRLYSILKSQVSSDEAIYIWLSILLCIYYAMFIDLIHQFSSFVPYR